MPLDVLLLGILIISMKRSSSMTVLLVMNIMGCDCVDYVEMFALYRPTPSFSWALKYVLFH